MTDPAPPRQPVPGDPMPPGDPAAPRDPAHEPAPAPYQSKSRWLWPMVIALLAVLVLVFMLSPSGDRDDPGVEDPIVIDDVSDPAADPAGALGAGLPGEGAADPAEDGQVVENPPDAPPVDPMPAE